MFWTFKVLMVHFVQFPNSSTMMFFTPCQTKTSLRKFLDSLLQKSGKIRGLIRELKESYTGSTTLQSYGPQIMCCCKIIFWQNFQLHYRLSTTDTIPPKFSLQLAHL